MSYNNSNLTLPALQVNEGGFYWIYDAGADTNSDVTDGGYFNGAFGRLRNGDIIKVIASNGTKIYRVTGAQNASSVTINGPVDSL